MEVEVDVERCIGSGQCVWAVSAVFAQREDTGTVVLKQPNPPESMYDEVREAQLVCPAGAIDIIDR